MAMRLDSRQTSSLLNHNGSFTMPASPDGLLIGGSFGYRPNSDTQEHAGVRVNPNTHVVTNVIVTTDDNGNVVHVQDLNTRRGDVLDLYADLARARSDNVNGDFDDLLNEGSNWVRIPNNPPPSSDPFSNHVFDINFSSALATSSFGLSHVQMNLTADFVL
jgi:hypothetical protein